jgi:hypothetical protein
MGQTAAQPTTIKWQLSRDPGQQAAVSGAITVGEGAQIGANAVVVKDIEAGAVAVGVPAKVIAKKPAARSSSASTTTPTTTPTPTTGTTPKAPPVTDA